ncbi:MAG: IS66 family transposase [Planctomycetes bacterium]|nr:IS66 family transposase [Planctomycetota bacterium]
MKTEGHPLELENRTLREQLAVVKNALQSALRDKQIAEERLARWLRRYFGRKSEKIDPSQLRMPFEELVEIAEAQAEPSTPEHAREAADDEAGTRAPKPRKKGAHGRKPLPSSLPRERVEHDVEPEDRSCFSCKREKQRIGEEITEELEYVPASFKEIEHVRPKYACKHCQEGVVIAELPARVIEKGRPGPGLLAFILTAKYCDHLPLHRLEGIIARSGLEISRSTMCEWVSRSVESLRGIGEALRTSVLCSSVLHGDDSGIQCLENFARAQPRDGYLWAYVGDRDEVVYDFTLSHARASPNEFLAGWEGKLQADGHTCWEDLYRDGAVVEVGCWAHARRYFFEAIPSHTERASRVVALIQRMYAVEKRAKAEKILPGELLALRRAESAPILAEIRKLIDEYAKDTLPKSGLGEALTYATNQWEALGRFVDDPELDIDNNAAERALRMVAVGRKNWLFAGSPEGGRRAALIYSLVGSCKLLGIDPFAYLRDVLARVAAHPASRIAELTPRGWKQARAAQLA